MALEDFCSFRNIDHLRSPASLLWPSEDSPSSTSGTTKHHHSGWRTSEKSYRGDGPPLCFTMPPTSSPHHLTPSVRQPFSLTHGTTTLAFAFQGGVIAAADTRASAGGLVACPSAHKIIPIHSHLVVTTSGSGADCMLWARTLEREIRLYRLRHGRLLSVQGAAKLLAFMLHPFKGTKLCVALTLCGWDLGGEGQHDGGDQGSAGSSGDATTTEASSRMETSPAAPSHMTRSPVCEQPSSSSSTSTSTSSTSSSSSSSTSVLPSVGPKVIYVCSDGARLRGKLFSVGSGSPYALGILDGGLRWTLSPEEAVSLAREAVFRATHRDAYSGNFVDLVYITKNGWSRRLREDLKEEYYIKKQELEKIVEERRRTNTD